MFISSEGFIHYSVGVLIVFCGLFRLNLCVSQLERFLFHYVPHYSNLAIHFSYLIKDIDEACMLLKDNLKKHIDDDIHHFAKRIAYLHVKQDKATVVQEKYVEIADEALSESQKMFEDMFEDS